MKRLWWFIIIFLVTSFSVFYCHAEDAPNWDTDLGPYITVNPEYLSFDDTFMIDPPTSIIIGYKNWVEISWEDGKVDIKYGENTSVSDAAKIFFDFLKQYIELNYDIIPKGNVKGVSQ